MPNPRVSDFTIEVPAKWVLAGEHSVLRGKRALAFPHPSLSLKLNSWNDQPLAAAANPLQMQTVQLIGRACEFLGLDPAIFGSGEIDIQSQIPMGAGLGSSAALSVAIARLVIWKAGAPLDQWIPLATHLEDVFHGKSSGMDVNVIAHSKPIVFSMKKKTEQLLEFAKLPRFQFYDSGLRGQTKLCIESVNAWRAERAGAEADEVDEAMGRATEIALRGLEEFQADTNSGEAMLARAMNIAEQCFETWGLVPAELLEQKNALLQQGALAVRLTGSGLGGFWVALWPSA